eukprot:4882457-Pleurochrysis_carterae.AAC.1
MCSTTARETQHALAPAAVPRHPHTQPARAVPYVPTLRPWLSAPPAQRRKAASLIHSRIAYFSSVISSLTASR